jgi:hypothetical protein
VSWSGLTHLSLTLNMDSSTDSLGVVVSDFADVEFETLLSDVEQNLEAGSSVMVCASQAVPLDDPSTDLDAAALVAQVRENLSSVSPTDAQKLLRRQSFLVSKKLMTEHAAVHVETDGTSGIHFLNHASREGSTPLYNLNGPRSGALYPADMTSFPGTAMLKLSATSNGKSRRTQQWTDAHERVAITAWREVQIGPKHGRSATSLGFIESSIRAPEINTDFHDIKPKVSLIIFTPRPSSPSGFKRHASTAGTSSDASCNDARFRKLEVDELRVGGVDVLQELAMLKAKILPLTGAYMSMVPPQLSDVSPSSGASTGMAADAATFRQLEVDELHVRGMDIAQELAILQQQVRAREDDQQVQNL